MAAAEISEFSAAFTPRARLLKLLGNQLIGSSRLAIFELVKNAYDADASEVRVKLSGIGTPGAIITVTDNGDGMTPEIIKNVWLMPGDDFREKQRLANKRTPKYHRLPLGEKGVGRFAVHKLGNKITLVTRAANANEFVAEFRWDELTENLMLSDAIVTVKERSPTEFPGDKTGTIISIGELSQTEWSRREVRELYRQVTSISSPFDKPDDKFKVTVSVPERPSWIKDMPDVRRLLNLAPWFFEFTFDGKDINYGYSFEGLPEAKIDGRTVNRISPLQVLAESEPDDLDPTEEPKKRSRRYTKVTADAETIEGIGVISGKFYVFDRDREILSRLPESRLIERFLDQNGGVRVYRDNIRVYNYGERSDDWLGLDLRRVNSPTKNISRNIIIGSIDLSLETSTALQEKTNREGFVENEAYSRLREVVLGALAICQVERKIDKDRIRAAFGKTPEGPRGVEGPISELRRLAARNNLAATLEPAIRRIEVDYNSLRESFLTAGLSQVGLALVFHEVERGVAVLNKAIQSGQSLDSLKTQAGELQRVLETSTQLLRKGERKPNSLRHLVRRARDVSLVRFQLHKVHLICPPLEDDGPDIITPFNFNLALGALTNLIDNAIHWLKVAKPADSQEERRIYMNVIPDFEDGPAIVVGDNGTGFVDPPEQVVQPFFSRRPEGMGLGLYYSNMVMQLNSGALIFPSAEAADVPEGINGAIVGLLFQRGE